jgi:hypothetical protein
MLTYEIVRIIKCHKKDEDIRCLFPQANRSINVKLNWYWSAVGRIHNHSNYNLRQGPMEVKYSPKQLPIVTQLMHEILE